MATSLDGLQISATYEALIKVGDNNPVTGVLKVLSDGDGNDLPVRISLSEVELTAGKTMTILGTLDTTSGVINVATPSQPAHATTKAYVDAQIVALDISQIETDIANNLAAIQVNANDIADNVTDIATNTSDIAALEAGTGNVIGVRSNANAYIAGNVTLQQGSNVTLSQSGSTITINSTGGGGGGGGHSFGTIASTGLTSIAADSGNDTLNIEKVANQGITFATDNNTKTFTIGTDNSVLAYRSYVDPVVNGLGSSITDLEDGVGNVTSFNTLTGDVTISGGTGITLTPSGNDIEIVATATSTTINNNADNRIITGSGTANTLNAEPALTYDGGTLDVSGDVDASGTLIGADVTTGGIQYSKQITIQTPSSTFPAQGELSPIAGTGLTAGVLYYLNSSGVWTIADATTEASCKNMLGIAISATQVMIRGHLSYTAYAGYADGEPLYVKPSATGDITNLVPSASGHIVRKVGFSLDGSVRSIYFNPSNDYFEVE